MPASIAFLTQLLAVAKHNNTRFGVVLRGEENWHNTIVESFINDHELHTIFQVGGEPHFTPSLPSSNNKLPQLPVHRKFVSFKQGKQLLGQECQVLICDFSDGFDANSFSAAIGTLVGGGILIIHCLGRVDSTGGVDSFDGAEEYLKQASGSSHLDRKWLEQGLLKLLNIRQDHDLPSLPVKESREKDVEYQEQELAIEKIIHVVEGHRKRPLVLTADRGRGKTSALGIASASLMKARAINIVVTAPTLATVAPMFRHAASSLSLAATPTCSQLEYVGEHSVSVLRFIAPDELVKNKIECDLLIVDEAAAIPIPMLKAYVESYHRLVLSSTIHGYEGSGRGFSLKFIPWLKQQRANSVDTHLNQPIRWQKNDPLERWHNQTFLLDADFSDGSSIESLDAKQLTLTKLDKGQLVTNPEQLRNCFALLVNAHYQTSPNDLFHLLNDDLTDIYAAIWQGVCVGCVLTVEEGGLSDEIISLVQQGKRRPSGQLVSITLANQLGISKAAKDKSIRIMRIAVHPSFQRCNIGSSMLTQLQELNPNHYLSTSFGATNELIQFWHKNQFVGVKLGSQRDKASGCYSLIMVKSNSLVWLERAEYIFSANLEYRITDSLVDIEIPVLRVILENIKVVKSDLLQHEIGQLNHYISGGSSFDSVAYILRRLIMSSLINQPTQQRATLIEPIWVTDLLIAKVLQQKSWEACSRLISATGRKQCERQLKNDILDLMTNLHCKVINTL